MADCILLRGPAEKTLVATHSTALEKKSNQSSTDMDYQVISQGKAYLAQLSPI